MKVKEKERRKDNSREGVYGHTFMYVRERRSKTQGDKQRGLERKKEKIRERERESVSV